MQRSRVPAVNYITSLRSHNDVRTLTQENFEDLPSFFATLKDSDQGFFEKLSLEPDAYVKIYFDLDFNILDDNKNKIDDETTIKQIQETLSELTKLKEHLGDFLIQGYANDKILENIPLPLNRYNYHLSKKCSFHCIFYNTLITRSDLKTLVKRTKILSYADRIVYSTQGKEQLMRHLNSLKIPTTKSLTRSLKIERKTPHPRADTYIIPKYDKTIKKVTGEESKVVERVVCSKYINSNFELDDSLIKKSFITPSEYELSKKDHIISLDSLLKSLNLDLLPPSSKDHSSKQKTLKNTISTNHRKCKQDEDEQENEIINPKSQLLSLTELSEFLHDFAVSNVTFEGSNINKEYNYKQQISWSHGLSNFIYILIVSCPYPFDDISKVITDWWNLRDHASGTSKLTSTLSHYKLSTSPDCYFYMLKYLKSDHLREHWLSVLKSRMLPSVSSLQDANPDFTFQQFIRRVSTNYYSSDTDEENNYKIDLTTLVNDMRTVLVRINKGSFLYFVRDECHKTTYEKYDKDTNTKKQTVLCSPYYSLLSPSEIEKSLRSIVAYSYQPKNDKKKLKKVTLLDILHNNVDLFSKDDHMFYSQEPNIFSFYHGYPFEERPFCIENVGLFLNFVYKVLCNYSEKIYKWLIDWIAYIIQVPNAKTLSKVIISGRQGIGKNFFTGTLCKILGVYANDNINDLSHVIGTFNTAAFNKKLVVCNEIAASSKERYYSNDALKSFDTEKYFIMNEKNEKAIRVENVCNMIITTNHYFLDTTEIDDRRSLFLNPTWCFNSENDRSRYFSDMFTHLDNYEFITDLYNFFLKHPITAFKPGSPPPTTEMKIAQKRHTLNDAQQFLLSNRHISTLSSYNFTEEVIKEVGYGVYDLISHPKYGCPKTALMTYFNEYLKANHSTIVATPRDFSKYFAPYLDVKKIRIGHDTVTVVKLKPHLKQHFEEIRQQIIKEEDGFEDDIDENQPLRDRQTDNDNDKPLEKPQEEQSYSTLMNFTVSQLFSKADLVNAEAYDRGYFEGEI